MTWPDRFYLALLLGCVTLYAGDCASKAVASGPSDVLTVGRDLVRAIDRNTKAIERCR